MEPRPYARLSVGALGLRFTMSTSSSTESSSTTSRHSLSPSSSSSSSTAAMATAATATVTASGNSQDQSPSSSPYFCKVKLSHFDSQTVFLPVLPPSAKVPDTDLNQACFYLDDAAIAKLLSGSIFCKPPHLCITVYRSDTQPLGSCYGRRSSVMGSFLIPVSTELASRKTGLQIHNGWVRLGKKGSKAACAELHVCVRVELDPRYIFQFDAQPELNPQIVQIQGNIRQPIFSCKFTSDRGFRTMGPQMDGGYGREGGKEREKKERKGWLVLIYDLSGSPVAAASMVTPFVPSAGSDRVSRSNPGAWLIMKAGPMGEDNWMPWGKLEAWRERGIGGGIGCRFHLMSDAGNAGSAGNFLGFHNYCVLVSESVIKTQKGDDFLIDIAKLKPETVPYSASPVESPQSSGDFYFSYGNPAASVDGGFVMSANVKGEGKRTHPPRVELAMRHVNSVGDAAVFMALAAAVDLSIDACLPFSKKLGKSFVAE